MKIIEEFKSFLLRGNVVDLAVAVVVGAAFSGLVNSLVENLITPLIAAIGGQPDFSNLTFSINGSIFGYGDFLNSLISFILISLVIFFFVVKPMNALLRRLIKGEEKKDPETKKCPYCFSDVAMRASKCRYCTSELDAVETTTS